LLDDDFAPLTGDLRIAAVGRAPALGAMTDGTGQIDAAAVVDVGRQGHDLLVFALGEFGGIAMRLFGADVWGSDQQPQGDEGGGKAIHRFLQNVSRDSAVPVLVVVFPGVY
jgi:hypothetical protein